MDVPPQLIKDPPDILLFDDVAFLPTLGKKSVCKMPQQMFAGDAVTLPDARGCALKVVVEFGNLTL